MAEKNAVLRRYQGNLVISGAAIVVLGVWDVVKIVMQWLFGAGSLQTQMDIDTSDRVELIAVFAIFIIVAAVDFAIRFMIWKRASREARGQLPRKSGWLVATALLAAVTLFSAISPLLRLKQLSDLPELIPTLIVDLTSIYAMSDLLRSAYMVRTTAQKDG